LNMSIPKADQQVFLSRRPQVPSTRHDSL
jgi:hypothetical protein